MMKTTRLIYLIVLVLCFLALPKLFFGQEFLKVVEEDNARTFFDMQKSFEQWSKNKDLNKEKGWKFFKRWEDFNAKRVSSDGEMPDPSVYLNEVNKINDQKQGLKSAFKNNYSWTPVGMFQEASVYYPDQKGIGRINCITFHPTDPDTFWVGFGQSGVWKTTNHGQSWTPLTDDLPMLRISDICVDKNDTDIMYISVGDFAYVGIGLNLDHRKRHTHWGIGVYKTTDGGQTWNPTGLSFEQDMEDGSLTRRVFIDDDDSNHLLAAGTQGIWESTDAGDNWTQIVTDPIWDFERDPQNPDIIYASKGYEYANDVGACGMLKTSDFGANWAEQTIDIPAQGVAERLEIAISPSDPNTVYVTVSTIGGAFYGLYATNDGGANWELRSNTPNIYDWYQGTTNSGLGSYATAIIVDQNDNNKIYAGAVYLWGSDDGGVTWDGLSYWTYDYGPGTHADQHFFAYNPLSSEYFLCNDGGLYYCDQPIIGSWDDAIAQPNYEWPTVWNSLNDGLVATSFYRLSVSESNADYITAGAQDNGTFYYNSTEWYNVYGGDGMESIMHPTNPNIMYCSYQRGNIARSDDGGRTFDETIMEDLDEDGEWVTPYVIHPSDHNTLYGGYRNVWKTTNSGDDWNKISDFPDQATMQRPTQISSMAVCDSDPDHIYVAKRPYFFYNEASALWKTNDGGLNWTDITAGLPNQLYFLYIAVDDDDPNTAWVTCTGFEEGNKVFKTTDGGQNWVNISRNLPNLPVNCIAEHHNKMYNPIYIGMDVGVYYTNDTMDSWMLFNDELPNVIISELEVHDASNKLFAATFGRGIWKVDLYESNGFTSIPEDVYNVELTISPNPNMGSFNLKISEAEVDYLNLQIIDITGRVQFTNRIDLVSGQYDQYFELNLNPGIYYANLSHTSRTQTVKFVVQ